MTCFLAYILFPGWLVLAPICDWPRLYDSGAWIEPERARRVG
jgi:hypothetical protein